MGRTSEAVMPCRFDAVERETFRRERIARRSVRIGDFVLSTK
jgi:hypothetical protein